MRKKVVITNGFGNLELDLGTLVSALQEYFLQGYLDHLSDGTPEQAREEAVNDPRIQKFIAHAVKILPDQAERVLDAALGQIFAETIYKTLLAYNKEDFTLGGERDQENKLREIIESKFGALQQVRIGAFSKGRPPAPLPLGCAQYYEQIRQLAAKAKSEFKSKDWMARLQLTSKFAPLLEFAELLNDFQFQTPAGIARQYTIKKFSLPFGESHLERKLRETARQTESKFRPRRKLK